MLRGGLGASGGLRGLAQDPSAAEVPWRGGSKRTGRTGHGGFVWNGFRTGGRGKGRKMEGLLRQLRRGNTSSDPKKWVKTGTGCISRITSLMSPVPKGHSNHRRKRRWSWHRFFFQPKSTEDQGKEEHMTRSFEGVLSMEVVGVPRTFTHWMGLNTTNSM